MSYLAIILVVVLIFKSKSNTPNGIFELLKNLDLQTILPLLELFGIDESLTKIISQENINNLLNGNLDMQSIISLLSPLISSFLNKKPTYSSVNSSLGGDGLAPIQGVVSDDLYLELENYFSN